MKFFSCEQKFSGSLFLGTVAFVNRLGRNNQTTIKHVEFKTFHDIENLAKGGRWTVNRYIKLRDIGNSMKATVSLEVYHCSVLDM